ncbi:MAG: ABC transporter permease [Acidobacteriia bacterium]|nr:ABC transporter permease [Terriglobia bacterium]
MDVLLHDIRYAFRRLKNEPAFAAVAILTLALGIGATSAIFSIVNAVLLRPLPFVEPSRLVFVSAKPPQLPRSSVSYQNYMDMRDQSHSFESFGAVRNALTTITGDGEPERLPAQMVTASVFDILRVRPELGRTFTAEEDRAGGPNVVVVSHGLWQRRLGGSSDAVGRPITLDNKLYTIIGVMPAGFEPLQQTPDFFFPFEPWAKTLPDDRSWYPGILPMARLKPGVSLEQARTEMTLIAKRLEDQYPAFNTGIGAVVNLMQEQIVENVRPALLMLMGSVAVVLLIACANVANLLLARAAGRQREMAVRTAIGASGTRIVRQLLAESVILAMAGGAAGLLLARLAMPPLVRLAGTSLPRSNAVSVDLTVLGFTTMAALVAGILFGLAPARHALRVDLRDALNESTRSGSSRGVLRARAFLVVAEIALAMVLLAGAGLLIRSFERLATVAPGFSVDHTLIADLSLSPNAYHDPTKRLNFLEQVIGKAEVIPGVRSAGAVSSVPVGGIPGFTMYVNIKGQAPRPAHDYLLTNYRTVSPGYLKTLQIPLIAGRWAEERDREDVPTVVVVNETLAKTFFPNQSPLGQFMQLGPLADKDVPWMEIVGVVGDVRHALSAEPLAEIYVPYRQADKVLPVYGLSLVLRTNGDPLALTPAVRNAVHSIDPNQPVIRVRTMEEQVATSIAQPRFRTLLLSILAGVALALAAVGVFSVMAYTVTQRTRELGVRIALGASRRRVLQLVLAHGVRLTLIGVLLGLAVTIALTRYVSSLLFGIPAYDPLTLGAVAGGLVMVSLCACYMPARRATLVDPIVALRQD